METSRRLWKVYARIYDIVLLRFHPYRELLNQVKESLDARNDWQILDAGCGTGNLLKAMSGAAANLSLIGIDFEKAMLERAKVKLGRNGKATLQQGNLDLPLPFADGEFDGIVCVNTLYALNKPAQFMGECVRLLKSSGRLVLVTPPEQPRMGPLFREHLQAMRQQYPLFWFLFFSVQLLRLSPSLLPFLAINRIIQRQSAFTFFNEKELSSLVWRCGLQIDRLIKTYGGQAWLLVCTKPRDTL
jgi:ubiquinone/menaquinone biosynthesis C-methylase UbiE